MRRIPFVLAALLVLGGCYHAMIETGLRPGTETIQNKWARGWILGLVPPKTVETMAKCPNGVARVETQLSFLNQLVNVITWGIYTPMQIDVTCAEAGQEQQQVSSADGFRAAVLKGEPFLVKTQ